LDGVLSSKEYSTAHRNAAARSFATLANPEVQEKLRALGAEPVAQDRMPPDRLPQFIAAEIGKWRAIIKKAGIRMD
jgi:tripartite-type tricarboxylate transporter receptor subunit TctC